MSDPARIPPPAEPWTPRRQSAWRLLVAVARETWAGRAIALRLAGRNLRAQYRQSYLGFAWAFIPPIALAVGCTLAARAQVLSSAGTELPFPLHVLAGTVAWQAFLEALLGPMHAYGQSKTLIAKVSFARETLLLGKLLEVLFNLGIKLLLLMAAFAWFGQGVGAGALLALVPILGAILLGTAIGALLAPVSLLFDDVAKGVTLFAGYWFFVTPVAYPKPREGLFATVVEWNPVTHLVEPMRQALAGMPVADWPACLAVIAAAAAVLAMAAVVNRIALPFAIERIGS